jgi:hypothetical protein
VKAPASTCDDSDFVSNEIDDLREEWGNTVHSMRLNSDSVSNEIDESGMQDEKENEQRTWA